MICSQVARIGNNSQQWAEYFHAVQSPAARASYYNPNHPGTIAATVATVFVNPQSALRTTTRVFAAAEQFELSLVRNLENPNFVLFKGTHLDANPGLLRPGEYRLNLPNLGNAELNWAKNEQALRRALSTRNPIRDLSPNFGGGFLQRERAVPTEAGWKFDPTTGYWIPPAQ